MRRTAETVCRKSGSVLRPGKARYPALPLDVSELKIGYARVSTKAHRAHEVDQAAVGRTQRGCDPSPATARRVPNHHYDPCLDPACGPSLAVAFNRGYGYVPVPRRSP